MMKKILVSAAMVAAATALTVAGCGSTTGSNNDDSGGDSGSPQTTGGSDAGDGGAPSTGPDGSTPIGTNDAGTPDANPPLPDGAVLPTGSQLVASPGATVSLVGVTSDDYVAYIDESGTTPQMYAVSLAAGSKPISLGASDAFESGTAAVVGKVLLFQNGSSQQGAGTLMAWTSAASTATTLSASSCSGYNALYGQAAVSSDNTEVLYFDGADSQCQTGTLTVAGPDGSGKTALIASVDLAENVCGLSIAFGGDHAVAAYCVTGGDGGVVLDAGLPDGGTNVNVATVSSFSSPSWTPVPIAVGVQPGISVDPAGTKVVLVGPTGTLAYPIGGGAPVTIDATGELGAFTGSPGVLVDDGGALVYTTTAQALERAATTTPAGPTQLVAAGSFADVLSLSPSQGTVVGALTAGTHGNESDLYLASATTAGSATTLSSTATAELLGDAFTADSTHALFYTAITHGVGTLSATAVTGGTATTLGTSAFYDLATSAAKVLFQANLNTAGQNPTGDVLSVDTSQTAAATTLVSVADPYPALSSDKTKLVYTWSYNTGSSAGLWVMPVP